MRCLCFDIFYYRSVFLSRYFLSSISFTFDVCVTKFYFAQLAGVEIQPEKPFLHTDEDGMTKLHLSQVFHVFLSSTRQIVRYIGSYRCYVIKCFGSSLKMNIV